MFKKLMPAVFCIAFLFLSTGSILAEAVVVKGDKIFVADGGLSVLELSDGSTAACSVVEGSDLALGLEGITDATDVVIADDGKAVVTTPSSDFGVTIVDVSSCLDAEVGVGVEACVATADLNKGEMDIPCLDFNGVVYNLHMEQRGNSMNWEITIIELNDEMSGFENDSSHDYPDNDAPGDDAPGNDVPDDNDPDDNDPDDDDPDDDDPDDDDPDDDDPDDAE